MYVEHLKKECLLILGTRSNKSQSKRNGRRSRKTEGNAEASWRIHHEPYIRFLCTLTCANFPTCSCFDHHLILHKQCIVVFCKEYSWWYIILMKYWQDCFNLQSVVCVLLSFWCVTCNKTMFSSMFFKAPKTAEDKFEIDSRSVYVGNVSDCYYILCV